MNELTLIKAGSHNLSDQALKIRAEFFEKAHRLSKRNVIQAEITTSKDQPHIFYYDSKGFHHPLRSQPIKNFGWLISPSALNEVISLAQKISILFLIKNGEPISLQELCDTVREFDSQTVCVSAMGLFEKEWFDGWLAIIDPTHSTKELQFAALIPPGIAGQLSCQLPIKDFFSKKELSDNFFDPIKNLHTSLLARLRMMLSAPSQINMQLTSADKFDALALILLRQAFPKVPIIILSSLREDLSSKRFSHLYKVLDVQSRTNLDKFTSKEIILDYNEVYGNISKQAVEKLYEYISQTNDLLSGI